MNYADIVLQNGPVITMDPSKRVVDSIAIKDEIIIAVGWKPEVKRLIGPDTEVIDLEGMAATPGLVDTHDHFLEHGIQSVFIADVRYPKARSIEEVSEKIAEMAKETRAGDWLLASGWDETLLEEHRYPNKWDLDPVSPDNPVWMKRVFEMGVANSRALEEAGITDDTPDPPHGGIERNEAGEATGLLRGRAMDLVLDVVPDWTIEDREKAIAEACMDFHAQGFTTVIDPGILAPAIEAYESSYRKGILTMRMLLQIGFLHDVQEVEWAIDNYSVGGDDHLRIIGLKFAVDGGVGPRTALLYEPYKETTGNRGVQLIDAETLKDMTRMGHEEGFQVAIHAIGERAIDIALEAYEHTHEASPRLDARHQLVHCYFPSEEALEKIVDMGLVVNTQTPFLYFLGDSFIEALGSERCTRCMPVRSMMERGIPVGISHDATVTPPLSSIGLYASTARKTIKGNIIGPEEAVTPYQALETYTTKASRHCYMEDKIGSFEIGKYGDIAVWNRSLLDVEIEELKDLRVELTIVGGTVRYMRNGKS